MQAAIGTGHTQGAMIEACVMQLMYRSHRPRLTCMLISSPAFKARVRQLRLQQAGAGDAAAGPANVHCTLLSWLTTVTCAVQPHLAFSLRQAVLQRAQGGFQLAISQARLDEAHVCDICVAWPL